jgi:serine/threonine-protein kinase HipA
MERPRCLEIFYGEERVGSIYDSSPLSFEYEASWLRRAEPLPVAAIPLQPGRQDSAAVLAFLENLLPEGELRHYVAEQRKASTLFSMLLEVAGDTAGAFVILPAGQTPQPPRYEPSSWAALARLLEGHSAAAIDIKGRGARISLAGAQDKTSIAIFEDGAASAPRHGAFHAHPQARHQAARKGMAFGRQRNDRHANRGTLRAADGGSVP